MAVGIKEIANELNLGVSTVAQALGRRGTVSMRTRQRVLEQAAKMGYIPNRNAQRMRKGRTGVIGLMVPDVVYSPYVEVVQHLFRLTESGGNELQIALTEFDTELEDRAFAGMLASRVDGVIAKVGYARWEDVPENSFLRRIVAEGTPVVLYSNPIEGSGLPYMEHPMQQSIKLVVRHLLSLGHRRIGGLIPAVRPFGPQMQSWVASIREEIAAQGGDAELEIISLQRDGAGIEGPRGVFPEYVNQNHPAHAVPAGRELLHQAMRMNPRPTAVVAYSDPLAIGAILEAQAQGLKVGRDIAIAGCGQMPTSFFSPVTLTTVDRRPLLYAEKLLGLLQAHMEKKPSAEPARSDRIEPLLVIGESTTGA